MWTDIQTDMAKLIVAFRNFANAPKTMAEDAIIHSPSEHVTGVVATDKSDRVAAAELG